MQKYSRLGPRDIPTKRADFDVGCFKYVYIIPQIIHIRTFTGAWGIWRVAKNAI